LYYVGLSQNLKKYSYVNQGIQLSDSSTQAGRLNEVFDADQTLGLVRAIYDDLARLSEIESLPKNSLAVQIVAAFLLFIVQFERAEALQLTDYNENEERHPLIEGELSDGNIHTRLTRLSRMRNIADILHPIGV
jgi:hypothetical protein